MLIYSKCHLTTHLLHSSPLLTPFHLKISQNVISDSSISLSTNLGKGKTERLLAPRGFMHWHFDPSYVWDW